MGRDDGTLGLAFDAPVDPDPVPVVAEVGKAVPFTWSEEHRHACEVRYVYSLGADRAKEYCEGVKDRRGRAAAERLWREARALNRKEKAQEPQ